MNEKIPLNLLAEKLAADKSTSTEYAENLLKTVFSLIGKSLIEDGKAIIPGLGTFTISGIENNPVLFTPAEKWSSIINAPFSIFDSEEIPSSVDIAELEEIGSDRHIPDVMPIEADEAKESEERKYPIDPEEPALNSNDSEIEEITKSKEEPSSQPEDNKKEESPVNAGATVIPNKESERYVSYVTESEENESGNSFSKGFIIGLIVGLAIGALALCCYVFYYVNTDPYKNPRNENIEEVLDEINQPELSF